MIIEIHQALGSSGHIKSLSAHPAAPREHAMESANEITPAMSGGPAYVNGKTVRATDLARPLVRLKSWGAVYNSHDRLLRMDDA